MSASFRDVGLTLGNFLGDRGATYAAGLGAGITKKALDLRGDILEKVTNAGKKWGRHVGEALPEALARGALTSGPVARDEADSKLKMAAGLDMKQIALWGVLILGGGYAVWMLMRSR